MRILLWWVYTRQRHAVLTCQSIKRHAVATLRNPCQPLHTRGLCVFYFRFFSILVDNNHREGTCKVFVFLKTLVHNFLFVIPPVQIFKFSLISKCENIYCCRHKLALKFYEPLRLQDDQEPLRLRAKFQWLRSKPIRLLDEPLRLQCQHVQLEDKPTQLQSERYGFKLSPLFLQGEPLWEQGKSL